MPQCGSSLRNSVRSLLLQEFVQEFQVLGKKIVCCSGSMKNHLLSNELYR